MGENSKIEWCEHTFNPWIGCTKVSPGCAHCYAEKSTRARVLRADGHETWGKGAERSLTSDANWKQPLKWNREAGLAWENWTRAVDARAGDSGPMPTRPRVFCASLADWLDDEVPIEWLARLLHLIMDTPNLDWLLLTKRPQNFRPRLEALLSRYPRCNLTLAEALLRVRIETMLHGWNSITFAAPELGRENYWIGTTVEDQARADERIPHLLDIPAHVRFLSCEPLLSAVDLERINLPEKCDWCGEPTAFNVFTGNVFCAGSCDGPQLINRIHWVICGGESGSNARPMHPDWARSLRDQCVSAGVPFFFKQWGDWVYPAYADPAASFDDFPKAERGQVWQPTSATSRHGYDILKLGKTKAGRLLDGREWNEFPQIGGAAS